MQRSRMYQRTLQGYEKALGAETVAQYMPALNTVRVRNGLGSTHGPWAGLGPLDQPTGNSWSSPFQWTEKSNPVQMFLSPVHLIWTGLNVMDRKVRSSPLDLGWADELDRKAWSSPFDLGSLRWTERYGPALSLSR